MLRDLPDLAQSHYAAQIDRVTDHIVRNLAGPLPLEELAAVAGFSRFHFHRIFKAFVGETPQEYTQRVRLERALFLMSHHRSLTLTEVARRCGFGSGSHFSRSFRSRYGVPPRDFDLDGHRRGLREELLQDLPPAQPPDGVPVGAGPGVAEEAPFQVRVVRRAARRVAYVRVRRPYEGGVPEAAGRLVAWAERRGLAGGRWLGYQWDDPEVVPRARCSYDVAVEIPDRCDRATLARRAGEDLSVGSAVFAATAMAEIDLDGTIETELQALTWLYARWLPGSGHVPEDQPCFEVWPGLPFGDGLQRVRLTLQLPVRRRSAG